MCMRVPPALTSLPTLGNHVLFNNCYFDIAFVMFENFCISYKLQKEPHSFHVKSLEEGNELSENSKITEESRIQIFERELSTPAIPPAPEISPNPSCEHSTTLSLKVVLSA